MKDVVLILFLGVSAGLLARRMGQSAAVAQVAGCTYVDGNSYGIGRPCFDDATRTATAVN